jgi:hypothetical protein
MKKLFKNPLKDFLVKKSSIRQASVMLGTKKSTKNADLVPF